MSGGSGSDLLAIEDMFAVLPHTKILREVIEKDCPGIAWPSRLSEKIPLRNRKIYEAVSEYRKDHPVEFVNLHNTMLVLSFISADPAADVDVENALQRFPDALQICRDYKLDMLPGVSLGSELAAVVYLNVNACADTKMAWLTLREDAITRMENHLKWGRWYNVETVTRSLDEMIAAKTKFEDDYRSMRAIERPEFDVDVIPISVPGKLRFVIEMSPPIQPTKEDERNPDTGHFNVTHNRNICQVILEYASDSEFVRMTQSRYGDDAYILQHLLNDVMGTKIIPMVKKVRHLDCFNCADCGNRLTVPPTFSDLHPKVRLTAIDISYGELASHTQYSPITIHDYSGPNIYEQIDRLLPPDRYPPSLRVIHSAEVRVNMRHLLTGSNGLVPSGKCTDYKITFKPKSISISPNIYNPNKVSDRMHAQAIEELIRCWQLEGTAVNQS